MDDSGMMVPPVPLAAGPLSAPLPGSKEEDAQRREEQSKRRTTAEAYFAKGRTFVFSATYRLSVVLLTLHVPLMNRYIHLSGKEFRRREDINALRRREEGEEGEENLGGGSRKFRITEAVRAEAERDFLKKNYLLQTDSTWWRFLPFASRTQEAQTETTIMLNRGRVLQQQLIDIILGYSERLLAAETDEEFDAIKAVWIKCPKTLDPWARHFVERNPNLKGAVARAKRRGDRIEGRLETVSIEWCHGYMKRNIVYRSVHCRVVDFTALQVFWITSWIALQGESAASAGERKGHRLLPAIGGHVRGGA